MRNILRIAGGDDAWKLWAAALSAAAPWAAALRGAAADGAAMTDVTDMADGAAMTDRAAARGKGWLAATDSLFLLEE